MISIDIHKNLSGVDGSMTLKIDYNFILNEITSIYGESGVGKTTLLKIIAGLITPDKGIIEVKGNLWYSSDLKINLKPQKRKIGMVFQDYALFPNMSVIENLEFARGSNSDGKIISKLIELMDLGNLQDKLPNQLSGGQQQRVALARALVQQPETLLLDEPLSALDLKTRLKLQDHILEIHKEFKMTVLLVSHDIGEIIKMSSNVIQLDKGQIKRSGSPLDVFISDQINGGLQLYGEVLHIKHSNGEFLATISVQQNIFDIQIKEDQATKLKIGDRILVSLSSFESNLKKINY